MFLISGTIRYRMEIWPGQTYQEHAQNDHHSVAVKSGHDLAHVFHSSLQSET